MLTRLFPKQIDNNFRGPALAIWLVVPLALMKFLQGANVAALLGPDNSRQVRNRRAPSLSGDDSGLHLPSGSGALRTEMDAFAFS